VSAGADRVLIVRGGVLPIAHEVRSSDGGLAVIGMREPVLMDPREQARESALRIVERGEPERLIRSFPGYADHVTTAAVSDDKRLVVFATRANTLEAWPLEPTRDFRWIASPVASVLSLSPDGRWLLLGRDAGPSIQDLVLDREIRVFGDGPDPLSAGAFCSGVTRVITGAKSGVVRVWDVTSGQLRGRSRVSYPGILAVSCASEGRQGVVATADAVIATIDVESGSEITRSTGPGRVAVLSFTPEGRTAIAGGADGSVTVAEVGSGRWIRLGSHNGPIVSVSIAEDGQSAATTDRDEVILWDLEGRREARRLRSPRGFEHVRLSADGTWALTGGFDSRLRVWETRSGQEVRSFLEFPEGLKMLHVATPALTVVSATAYGGRVVWDFARAPRYLDFRRRLPAALETLRHSPKDGPSLRLLGQWYAFRAQWRWAVDMLRAARANGADVDGMEMAQVHWLAGDREAARLEFQAAKEQAAPLAALYLDALAVDRPREAR
jgi:hypothetical protein